MTKVQATAKCPSCTWKFYDIFFSDEEALDIIHSVNEEVDLILIEHLKTHEGFSQFLIEAAKEQPLEYKPIPAFRGSFDLEFKEIP